MKVVFLIWSYWPGLEGGSERQCRKVARSVAARGVDCEVVAARTSLAMPRREIDAEVVVNRLGWFCPVAEAVGRGLRRWVSDKAVADGASNSRRRALVFWLMLPWVWLARLSFLIAVSRHAARWRGVPLVFHLHEPSWLGGYAVWLARRVGAAVICQEATFPVLQPPGYDVPLRQRWQRLRPEAWHLAMAPYIREALIAHGIPADRVFDLPNGVCLPETPANRDATREVLYVGNFSQGTEWKAFDVLIRAWAGVQTRVRDARLCLVGGGDPKPWEELAIQLGCRDSLSFVGRVENPDLYYRRATAFVLPSRVEGLSNALLEAQSWGLPCVVSNIPGNTAVVTDDINGLVVPVGDAPALREAITRLLLDPALQIRLGGNARRKAAAEYDIARVTDHLIDLYRHLLQPGFGRST